MAKIKLYVEACVVCGITIDMWAHKTKEIKFYFHDKRKDIQEKPICSHTCMEEYRLCPLLYDDTE